MFYSAYSKASHSLISLVIYSAVAGHKGDSINWPIAVTCLTRLILI